MMENIFFEKKNLKFCGENVIIGRTVRIRKPNLVSISDNSIIDDFTYIPCALEVGSYTHIGANCSFIGGAGRVSIGSFVNIAPGCQIATGSNDYFGGGLVGPCIPEAFAGEAIILPIRIGDHCLLACQTVVLPGVELPEGVATGAMTLLKQQVYDPWMVYIGIPASPLRARDGSAMKKMAAELMMINR